MSEITNTEIKTKHVQISSQPCIMQAFLVQAFLVQVIVGAAASVVEVLVEGEEERKVWDMKNPYETYLSKLDGEESIA